jgi:cytochrome P450
MEAPVIEDFEYDPFRKDVMQNPHPAYNVLRNRFPAYYIDKFDAFAFSRFDDVLELMSYQDNIFLTSEASLPSPKYLKAVHHRGATPLPPTMPMPQAGVLGSPYYEDIRQAYIKPFRPRSVQHIHNFIRGLANERLDALLPLGRFDLVQDFAGIVAASVTCHFFDIPLERAPRILSAINESSITDPEEGGINFGLVMAVCIEEILPSVIRRRTAGADGSVPLIDGMIHYQVDGRPLTDMEITQQLLGPFVGGTETVPKIFGHGLMELADRPEQLSSVRADLAANAPLVVEEMIRYCAPAQWFMRTAQKDVVVGGQLVKAGQRAIALFGSAARDEREFEKPDEFIWNRKIPRVLSFGFGQHHCVGLHVARAELRILTELFLSRVPIYRVDKTQAVRLPSSFQWGWNRVPVEIG